MFLSVSPIPNLPFHHFILGSGVRVLKIRDGSKVVLSSQLQQWFFPSHLSQIAVSSVIGYLISLFFFVSPYIISFVPPYEISLGYTVPPNAPPRKLSL